MQTYWMALPSHTFVIFKESFLRDQNCLPELIFSLDQDLLLNGECVFFWRRANLFWGISASRERKVCPREMASDWRQALMVHVSKG